MAELLGAHALDKVDFVARRFQPPDRLVIVKQADIHRGEVSLIQHFGDFLPFERGGAHDSRAVELPARRNGKGWGGDFRWRAHEVCEASL